MVERHNRDLLIYLVKKLSNNKSSNKDLNVLSYIIAPLCNDDDIELIIQVVDKLTESMRYSKNKNAQRIHIFM